MATRGGEELWRPGLIIKAPASHSVFKNDPLSVVLVSQHAVSPLISHADAIAIGRQSLLDTYDYYNDYSGTKRCTVKRSDLGKCRWPQVIVVPSAYCGSIDLEGDSSLDVQVPKDLEVKAGSVLRPTVLVVSPLFLMTYGFASKERVWFHPTTPIPLKKIVLAPSGTTQLSEKEARDIVRQLYSKTQDHIVMAHQGFQLPHPSTAWAEGIDIQWISVVETGCVQQGKVTRETTVVFLPADNQLPQSPRGEKRPRSASALSASDLCLEYLHASYLMPTEDLVIQVIPAPVFKLHSQYIVLPEDVAGRHGIFYGQPVMLSRTEPELDGSVEVGERTISELVVNLDPSPEGKLKTPRQHLALAATYKDEFTLRNYVPAPDLQHRYEGEGLQVAYIDQYTLFALFPETLAFSRKFYLRISGAISEGDIPTIKNFSVALVTIPPGRPQLSTTQHIEALKEYYHDTLIRVHVGDVFPVDTPTGTVYYMYQRLDQTAKVEAGGMIDGKSYKNCSVMVNQRQSFLPTLVPPSSIFPKQGFWSHLHPPGLEDVCDTLFSMFVPALLPQSQRLTRSSSVLVSGPPGVGKKTVIRAVTRRCRMNFMEFNCYEFTTEALNTSEQKLVSRLGSTLSSGPVVVLLTNIHVLGRKQDGKDEPRISTAFETFMSDVSVFNKKREYPVVIVGVTSDPLKVSPQTQACFLHYLTIPPPSQYKRESFLSGLSSEYLVAKGLDWYDLAKRTAGFVLGDFVTMFSRAARLAQHQLATAGMKGGWSVEDVSMAGAVISEKHIEASLNILHSSHSDAIGAPKIPNVQWEDVGGLAEAKQEILDTIQLPLNHPELFTTGLRRSGVLLYGAPGTGKTLLAKAVATECSLNFLSVKGPELINMYVGQSEENVREVFIRARSAAPCVIFFDELDSIAPNRGRSGDSGGVMDRIVSQLLAELDGLQKSEDVFVIGATNRPDLLDQALLRPGRFDRLVYLGVSEDVESKVNVLKALTRKFNLGPCVDLKQLASQCPANTTGADLYALCADAALIALRRHIGELEEKGLSDDDWKGQLVVTQEDFQQAISTLTPSVSPEELKRYTELGRQHRITTTTV